ncbi:MAG: MFS transporter, partial [Paludibacteraceae bacterium]|nr:MFS transporter [Paludibacteraceae bacterium]
MNKTNHPRGLYLLFATEMWERFSYYGMRALFVLYLTKALLMNKEAASNLYGNYTGLVYLSPLIGGYLADRYLGNRKSIISGGVLMAMGQFSLFLSASNLNNFQLANILMLIGLGLLIIGNGFFKPNISTMVGELYEQNDKRKDSAYTIFYMGINLGAFFSPLVCGSFGETEDPSDFKWGFLAAFAGMVIGTLIFILFKDKYLISPEGKEL